MSCTLAVGLDAETMTRVMPLFDSRNMTVEAVPQARDALGMAVTRRYDLIACSYPLPDMVLRDFGDEFRRVGSASRDAALLVLALRDMCTEARLALPRGRALVRARRDTSKILQETLGHLLRVAPRHEIRATAALGFPSEKQVDDLTAMVKNISSSGMLLQHEIAPPMAACCRFEITADVNAIPVRGEAEVVRRTAAKKERLRGFALRFTSFEDTGRADLDALLRG